MKINYARWIGLGDTEIVEENKLIAEFMGHKKTTPTEHQRKYLGKSWAGFQIPANFYDPKYEVHLNRPEDINICNVFYHKSFDWLMPVVDKIEELGFQFFIHNDGAYMRTSFWKGNFPDFGNIGESKIKATHKTVVQFIRWYNEHKTDKQ